MTELVERRTGKLTGEGKKLWEKVYRDSQKGDCDKSCAAGKAWKAVENAGWKKDEKTGKWMKKAELSEFSLRIEKAYLDPDTNERRWRAVASDTEEDSYSDNMSTPLFESFLSRIESGEEPPAQYCSEFWAGGLPYLSISHYPDFDGNAVPGDVEKVYIDGKYLKSRGTFDDTPIGEAAFEAVKKDFETKSKTDPDRVRISIAFLDYKHKHKSNGFVFERKAITDVCPECVNELINGNGQGKTFLDGHLIHLALTRVPVNKRTLMEVDRSMSEIKTRKDDAASIIGEDLAEEVDEMAKSKADVAKAMVIKSEEDDIDALIEESAKMMTNEPPDMEEECMNPDTGEVDQDCMNAKMENKKSEALVEEAMTKKESWGEEGSGSYLVVGDPKKVTTWHLPYKKHGKIDRGLAAAAYAALTSNHRGKSYSGPDKSKALSKLKGIYKKQGWDLPSKSEVEEIAKSEVYRYYIGEVGVVSEPQEYRPFGGATSLSEAKDFIASKKEQMRMADLWYAFESVVQNIGEDDNIDDKPTAIVKAATEFKTMMADQSAAIYTSLVTLSLPKESAMNPLDEAWKTFSEAYETVAKAEGTKEQKLQTLQGSFNELAKSIADSFEGDEVPASEGDNLVEALSKVMAPISQKLDMVLAQGQQPENGKVPQRRSISPEIAQRSMFTQPKPKSETPKIRALVEQTT